MYLLFVKEKDCQIAINMDNVKFVIYGKKPGILLISFKDGREMIFKGELAESIIKELKSKSSNFAWEEEDYE